MQVIFNYDRNHGTSQPCAIALGTFDGIHLGHRQLITELKELNKQEGYKTVVYTFLTHPLQVLAPEKAPPSITLLGEKIREFSQLGLDMLVLNPFDDFFSHLTPDAFIDALFDKYNIKALVVGFDFRFGHKGRGDRVFLDSKAREKGFELICVPPVLWQDQVVSSTLIRSLITDGRIEEVSKLLTKPYSIKGKVIHGYGRGTGLGFPTANLQFSPKKVIPKPGVYLTQCKLNSRMLWGVTSVGWNPTFSTNRINIETYLLDYEGDLYGKDLKVSFLSFMRDEIKFNKPSDLAAQIRRDVENAKKLIYNL